MLYIYMDAEFDAIRKDHKYIQCVISIGAVVCDASGNIQDTFYALIRPKGFQRLSKVVSKMTQLKSEEIQQADSFRNVMKQWHAWLKQVTHGETYEIYSFGNDDGRTLQKHATYEAYEESNVFSKIKDAQAEISKEIYYQKRLLSPTLSLDDLKMIYHCEEKVTHNAQTDAMDLMQIHQLFLHGATKDEAKIQEIWERKQKKLEEGKQKNFEKTMQRVLFFYQKKRQDTIKKQVDIQEILPFLPTDKKAMLEKEEQVELQILWNEDHQMIFSITAKHHHETIKIALTRQNYKKYLLYWYEWIK